MKWKILILIVVTIVLVASFKFLPKACHCSYQTPIKIGETLLKVEIAGTAKEREQGLSGRKGLKVGEGMLFVFEQSGIHGFWMKDMNFDLDLVWIDEAKRVVGISKGVTKESYPQIFYPPKEIKYVLEIPSGFSDTTGVKVGQILFIEQ